MRPTAYDGGQFGAVLDRDRRVFPYARAYVRALDTSSPPRKCIPSTASTLQKAVRAAIAVAIVAMKIGRCRHQQPDMPLGQWLPIAGIGGSLLSIDSAGVAPMGQARGV